MAKEATQEDQVKKPESIKGLLVIFLMISIFAVGAGGFIGMQLASGIEAQETPSHAAMEEDKDEREEHSMSAVGTIFELAPVLAALAGDDSAWMRLEVVLITDGDAMLEGAEIKLRIRNGIVSMIRNITLSQISGASGLIHLKEDLLDTARLITQGHVLDLMIMSIVTE